MSISITLENVDKMSKDELTKTGVYLLSLANIQLQHATNPSTENTNTAVNPVIISPDVQAIAPVDDEEETGTPINQIGIPVEDEEEIRTPINQIENNSDTDINGIKWNPVIHSQKKTKNVDGSWRFKTTRREKSR
jgi:hypothetical protein